MICDSLREHVEYSLQEHVEYSLWEHVEYSLWEHVEYSLREHVEYSLREHVEYSLREHVEYSLREHVEYSLREHVLEVLEYESDVWVYRILKCLDNIQGRAIRYLLGVHTFTSLAALRGEVGWHKTHTVQ